MAIPTEELIRRYQAGQTGLFEAIFDRYKDYVYRIAYGLTRHAAESEEVVQEAFLDVLKALPRYDVNGPARFETWLYRVTANRCKMRFRRKEPDMDGWDEACERLADLPDNAHEPDPEHVAQQAETSRSLWQAVGKLKDIYRAVIVLRYGQDFSYQEMADALKVDIGTIKSRLNAAHRQLQAMVGDGTSGDRTSGDGTPGTTAGGSGWHVFLLLLQLWMFNGLCRAFKAIASSRSETGLQVKIEVSCTASCF